MPPSLSLLIYPPLLLYLVATPIGHLQDLTFRALELLRSCDAILCEDTRHSLKLLTHYQIRKPLFSYHKFNEAQRLPKILEEIGKGKKIALISDAGTPGIADPGQRLVHACRKANLPVTALPGPCALIDALVLSGLSTERFQFVGFLPKQRSACLELLQEIFTYPGTSIAYISPHQITHLLTLLSTEAPNTPLVIARELSKQFEELIYGLPNELLTRHSAEPLRGECVLLIEGSRPLPTSPTSPAKEIEELLAQGLSRKEACKRIAKKYNLSSRDLYTESHRPSSEEA